MSGPADRDGRCRITVVGAHRRADLLVPARAGIAEYTGALLDLCGREDDDGTFPAVWSLAPAIGRPYPPSASLAELGVPDGATLYLRDLGAGELDEPVITDLDEIVGAANQGERTWDARLRSTTVLLTGLTAVVAGFAVLATRPEPPVLAGIAAALLAVGAAVLARRMVRRRWPVPGPVVVAVALAAVPLSALAPLFIAPTRVNAGTVAIGLVIGAVPGAFAARLAVPRLATLLALALTLGALPVVAALGALRPDRTEGAAVLALLGLVLLGYAPALAGHLVSAAEPDAHATAEPGTELLLAMVARGRAVLFGLTVLAATLITGCVLILAASGEALALGLAAALGLTLLLRTGQVVAAAAALVTALAGGVSLAAAVLLAAGPIAGALGVPAATQSRLGPVALIVAGAVALTGGVSGAFRVAADPADPAEAAAWPGALAGVLTVACVVLTVGVFGVFGYLTGVGGRL